MYRRVVVSRPGHLALETVQLKEPGQGQVRIRMLAATICHTDQYLVAGTHPSGASYPIVPGHEIAGTVDAIGPGVQGVCVGTMVAICTLVGCGRCIHCYKGDPGTCANSVEIGSDIDGGWQEFITIPVGAVRPADPSLSALDVALTEPSANAHAVVRAADIKPADVVAIIGPGPIGLLSLQYALLRHPRSIIMIGLPQSTARLDLAASLGASLTFAGDTELTQAFVADATDGRGADVVLQCAGSVRATMLAIAIAGINGCVAIEGVVGGGKHSPMTLDPDLLVQRQLCLRGVRGWTISDFEAALAINGSGRIRLGIVSHVFDLHDYQQAWSVASDEASGAVKVAFMPGS